MAYTDNKNNLQLYGDRIGLLEFYYRWSFGPDDIYDKIPTLPNVTCESVRYLPSYLELSSVAFIDENH